MDRVVVLRRSDPLGFVADACAALADSVNETRLANAHDGDLIQAYAGLVVAYAVLVRASLDDPRDQARVAVLDHLTERLCQAQRGEIETRVVDLVDRLHGELTSGAARS